MLRTSLVLVLLSAGAAHAQGRGVDPELLGLETQVYGQRELDRERDIALHNDLQALDSRVTSDQRLRELDRHGLDLSTPPVIAPSRPFPAAVMNRDYPSIPDAALAASRARVRDAASNRR